MNDNHQRGLQWQRLVGEFFPSLLGGTSRAWAEANRLVAEQLFEPAHWQARLRTTSDYASFEHAYRLDWLNGMCSGRCEPP